MSVKKAVSCIALIAAMAFSACNRNAGAELQTAGMRDFNASESGAVFTGEVKLPESMTRFGSLYDEVTRFEYDDQNRIIKIMNQDNEALTLTYSGGDLVNVVRTANTAGRDLDYEAMDFHIGRNLIGINRFHSESSLTVNNDGYTVRSISAGIGEQSDTSYQYQGGNLIKQITAASYEFDIDLSGEKIEITVEYQYDDMISPFYHCKTPKWFLQYMFNMGLHNNIVERRDSSVSYGGGLYTYIYEYDFAGYPTRQTMTSPNGGTTVTAFTYRAPGASAAPQSQTAGSTGLQELRIDSTISGNLNSGQENWYSVRTAQAGFLTVEISGFIDTYLIAYNAQRNYITENDDWNGLNPRIEFIAEADATYLFELKGFSSDISGAYQIKASFRPMPVITPLYSGSERGIIESGQEFWYSVNINAPGVLNVQTFGGADTVLEMYNTDFEYILSDNDSGGNFNALINMEVRPGQTWYFRLTAVNETPAQFEIIARANPYPAPADLAPGTFHNAYIEQDQEHWYSVKLTTGGSLTVETLGATDTTLEAFNSSYESIAYNDDTWIGNIVERNAKLEIFVSAPYGAVYFFRLKSFGAGSYRILASYDEAKG